MRYLIMVVNKLNVGEIIDVTHEPVGICERLTLHCKGGSKIVVESAERVAGSRQLAPSLRLIIGTITNPGFSPASAERTLKQLGFASVLCCSAIKLGASGWWNSSRQCSRSPSPGRGGRWLQRQP